jgi:hypothetical protein
MRTLDHPLGRQGGDKEARAKVQGIPFEGKGERRMAAASGAPSA